MFRKNKPDWIKTLPQIEQEAIKLLVGKTKVLESPREMNISLYGFKSYSIINRASSDLASYGWKVEVQEQGDEKGSYLVTGSKDGYVIDENNYKSDIALFK
jgi:hypothetical protein